MKKKEAKKGKENESINDNKKQKSSKPLLKISEKSGFDKGIDFFHIFFVGVLV